MSHDRSDPAGQRPSTGAGWLDGLPQAACLIDPVTLTVRSANAGAARLFGRPLSTLPGLPVAALADTPEDALFWLEAADPAALERGLTLHSDSLVLQADGRSIAVERRVAPFVGTCESPAWLLSWIDREAEQRLAREVDRLAGELGATLASSRDAILVTDLDGRVRGLNAACAALWDLPADLASVEGWDEARLLAHLGERLADPLGYARQLHARQQALDAGLGGDPAGDAADDAARCAVDRIACADGRVFERRLMPQYGRGRPVGWIQVWHDLSPALAQEARLQLAAQVFDASLDALLVLDASHRVIAANPAAAALSGLPRADLGGRAAGQLLLEPAGAARARSSVEDLLACVAPGRPWRGELQLQAVSGAVPVQAHLIAHGTAPTANPGHDGACIVVLRDLREREAQQRQLRELAETDGLTGLPNRIRLEQRIEAAIERQRQGVAGGGGFALLMFGLERLDRINDSLGHGCGDQVLVEMARRLGSQVRGADTLGRLAGDSYVLMLDGADAAQAEAVARRLLQAMAEPLLLAHLNLAGLSLTVKASAGIALFPADGGRADTLLRNADSAMQAARLQQGGELRFYQPAMNRDLLARLQLDQAMRQGLAAGHFRLQYQPQIDLRDGRIIGAEALCRWTDPQRGPVSPGQFIGVAEETGFIAELGDWVLHEAVAQAARWHRAGRALPVSVNVSALQFRDAGFVAGVARALAEAELPAGLLELELTESLLLDEVDAHLQQLQALADLGVRLAIDDFGTGYSSLRYLKRLPIHRLKIDREFIRNLPDDASDRAITHTIVQLAHALGLDVVAEGVETDAQHRALCELGCASFQGFLVAGALTVPDFEALLSPPRRKLA